MLTSETSPPGDAMSLVHLKVPFHSNRHSTDPKKLVRYEIVHQIRLGLYAQLEPGQMNGIKKHL